MNRALTASLRTEKENRNLRNALNESLREKENRNLQNALSWSRITAAREKENRKRDSLITAARAVPARTLTLPFMRKLWDNRIRKLFVSLWRKYSDLHPPRPTPTPRPREFNRSNFNVKNAGGGGDCFYLSLRLAAGLTDTVQEMRNKIVAKILSNWNSNRFKKIYLSNKNYAYNNRHEYATRMKGKCWAGHDEIEAASHVYKRNICIVSGANIAKFPMEQNHPSWPRVYILTNATPSNHEVHVTMNHFRALIPKIR
jgi:hypothetical protein